MFLLEFKILKCCIWANLGGSFFPRISVFFLFCLGPQLLEDYFFFIWENFFSFFGIIREFLLYDVSIPWVFFSGGIYCEIISLRWVSHKSPLAIKIVKISYRWFFIERHEFSKMTTKNRRPRTKRLNNFQAMLKMKKWNSRWWRGRPPLRIPPRSRSRSPGDANRARKKRTSTPRSLPIQATAARSSATLNESSMNTKSCTNLKLKNKSKRYFRGTIRSL